MSTVHLIWTGGQPQPHWPLGRVVTAADSVVDVGRAITQALSGSADALVFWDGALGLPDPAVVESLLAKPGDVFHAGLLLGMGGQPDVINYVKPTWMHNIDPPPDIEATSWRLSLRCCLVRAEVLRQLGGPRPEFHTLAGASLEFGYRCIRRGAVIRHTPALLARSHAALEREQVPFSDQAVFLRLHFSRFWNAYALFRAWRNRQMPFFSLLRYGRRVIGDAPVEWPVYTPPRFNSIPEGPAPRVSVLIPTLGRYDYLRKLLTQLDDQTISPYEIMIIDQSDERERVTLKKEFSNLPIKIIKQNVKGQSTARNAGLLALEGEYVLFLDDDEEISRDLIQKHLRMIFDENSDVSSGIVYEGNNKSLPLDFSYRRVSDVFPAGNSMVKMASFKKSGLFDLAFDHGPRADADLGTRLYLSGALMILNPDIDLIHHHAPAGGLRTYKARAVTYASSRKSMFIRRIAAATEFYLERRYCSPDQIREAFIMKVIGSFAFHGSKPRKVLKAIVSLFMLPDTISSLRKNQVKSLLLQTNIPPYKNNSEEMLPVHETSHM